MFGLIGGFFRLITKLVMVAGLVGVVIAYANLSDVDGWSRELQKRVIILSGRKLSVDGVGGFEISYPPRIVLRGVRLENADWGSRPDMFIAEKLIAEVDFMPLLLGEVVVPRVEFVGVDMLVETNRRGRSNWDGLSDYRALARISLNGGNLTIRDHATGAKNSIKLPASQIELAD